MRPDTHFYADVPEAVTYHVEPLVEAEVTYDVVFLHGLKGDALFTWFNQRSGLFAPTLLAQNLSSKARILSLGYPTRLGAEGQGHEDIAREIAKELAFGSAPIGERPCIFVCHSLGGLVLKRALLFCKGHAEAGYSRVWEAARGVLFIASPHKGARLATFARILRPFFGKDVRQLALDSFWGDLQELHSDFLTAAEAKIPSLKTYAFAETLKLRILGPIGVQVVSRDSATLGMEAKSDLLQGDHFQICKPDTADAKSIKLIEAVIAGWIDDFQELAPTIVEPNLRYLLVPERVRTPLPRRSSWAWAKAALLVVLMAGLFWTGRTTVDAIDPVEGAKMRASERAKQVRIVDLVADSGNSAGHAIPSHEAYITWMPSENGLCVKDGKLFLLDRGPTTVTFSPPGGTPSEATVPFGEAGKLLIGLNNSDGVLRWQAKE